MAAPKPAPPPVTLASGAAVADMSANERIKVDSQGLFYVSAKGEVHTFLDEIEALDRGEAETLSGQAKEISKFFGIYQQQARGDRGKKLKDFFFMVRIKAPGGGGFTPDQWRALDDAADHFADGTLRITSRQGIQYHHVYGPKVAPLIRHLNRHYRDHGTLSACGDVNRNVMGSPIDGLDPEHDVGGKQLCEKIAEELAPRTSAYFQIFLSDEEGRNVKPVSSDEPLYGPSYLPRKFKVGIAHPTDNSMDVLTQDVAFVPVPVNGRADGRLWDLYSGGGLGLTHNRPSTAALLGQYLGRLDRSQIVDAVKGIMTLQKEHGDRKNRRQARWKYTIRRLGLDAVKRELADRFGVALRDAPPVPLPPMNLHLGWHEQRGGDGYYGISVENGRVTRELRQGIRAAVDAFDLDVRLTPQQDILLSGAPDHAALTKLLAERGVRDPASVSRVRANSMACPAKPTCGLAMTEAERILPSYMDALEDAGLGDVDVVIRMTGCPNGCARPPTAEIGIFGYGKDEHVVLVGGSREGTRIARELYARVPGEQMIRVLAGLVKAIRDHNPGGLPAGEFLHRTDSEQLRAWVGVADAT
ncbi:MAG: NADPH-dependent assimilatory sulfite reductase hemoprotein subunit [Myxococcota bacterium]